MLRKYLPGAEPSGASVSEMQGFAYDLRVKEAGPLLRVFAPAWRVAPGSRAHGSFYSLSGDFSARVDAPAVQWNEWAIRDLAFDGRTAGADFEVSLDARRAAFRDSLVFNGIVLRGATKKTSGWLHCDFHGRDSALDNVSLRTAMDYVAGGKVLIQVLPSVITVEGTAWTTDFNNRVLVDSAAVLFENVNLHSGGQRLGLRGELGRRPDQALSVETHSFRLHPVNKILGAFGLHLDGTATGRVDVHSALQAPRFSADLRVRDLSFDYDTLGDARILSEYHAGQKKVRADVTIGDENDPRYAINGTYFFGERDSLDFQASLKKASIRPLGPYLSGFAHDLRGYLSGEVTLKGTAARPLLRGAVRLHKCSFVIDYLNTRVSLSDEVQVLPDRFVFDKVTVNDPAGGRATADGYIYHDAFSDFGIRMTLRAERFACLHTTARDNELFYGTGVATGHMRITGPFELIAFDGALRTERGTEISIPLSNPEDVTASRFITFIRRDTTAETPAPAYTPVDLSGIDMKLDLEMTDDALVKLIYDEKIGDKLEGRGNGNLMLDIGADGTFTMRGGYTVSSGNYVFTLQNVINKRFDLEPGGTIRWSGSPYDADVTIDAVYSRRASLYDLLRDTASGYTNRVPVEVVLKLRNRLLNPDVRFDIRIPDVDPATQGQIRSAIVTEEEKNQQALSLLVLNRFSPGRNLGSRFESSGGEFGANASELLSVQASNWLQSLTDNVDIGINYRAGDRFNSEELEIMLGKKFFNDRVSVETTVGYTGNNYVTADQARNASNLVGDFNIDVQLTRNNRFHLKAFNRSNTINFLSNFNSQYTQGIGVFYRQEFNTLGDIFGRKAAPPGPAPGP
jgi:hypothetical protein